MPENPESLHSNLIRPQEITHFEKSLKKGNSMLVVLLASSQPHVIIPNGFHIDANPKPKCSYYLCDVQQTAIFPTNHRMRLGLCRCLLE
jgi:hypothetical protein